MVDIVIIVLIRFIAYIGIITHAVRGLEAKIPGFYQGVLEAINRENIRE